MRFAGALSIPLMVLLSFGLARWFWVMQMESESESRTRELAADLAGDLVAGRSLQESVYRPFVQSQSERVGYLAVANFKNGFRSGLINATLLERSHSPLLTYRREHGDTATLARLTEPGAGFPGEYMDVLSLAFVPPAHSSDHAPIGVLKVGYVLPGYPLGRGYIHLWWVLMALASVMALGGWGVALTSRERPMIRVSEATHTPKDELTELEHDLEIAGKVEVDSEGRTWRVLFNGEDLQGWSPQGNWYVFEETVMAQPWGSSLVHEHVATDGNYFFQASGRKLSGSDGLILLFTVDGKPLAWVLGGWQNRHSEVGGYPSTRSNDAVELHRWYDMEVRILHEHVQGYLDGRKIWELKRAEVATPSPSSGFQEGLGVAVWSALAKFRNLKFHTL